MNDTRWFHDLTTDEARQERATLAQRVIAWLGVVCLIVLVGLATNAHATEIPVHVVEHPQVKMRLLKGPCEEPTSLMMIATAPPQFQGGWKAIASVWLTQSGAWQEFAGCWLEVPKEVVGTPENVMVLVFSDGAVVQVLKSELLKKSGEKGA